MENVSRKDERKRGQGKKERKGGTEKSSAGGDEQYEFSVALLGSRTRARATYRPGQAAGMR